MSLAQLEAFRIPLPPLEEQKRIASILDQADEVCAKRRAQLTHFDELQQSLFHEMFDPTVSTQPFGKFLKEVRYGTSNKSKSNGLPTLRIPNVVGGTLDLDDIKSVPVTPEEFERLKLEIDDILFVRSNGNPDYVGRSAPFSPQLVHDHGIDPNGVIFASYLLRARLTNADPVFISTFMASPTGRRQLRTLSRTSAGQYNLNSKNLATVKVPAVPLTEQLAFAKKVETIQVERKRVARALETNEELFAALQYRAFRSEL